MDFDESLNSKKTSVNASYLIFIIVVIFLLFFGYAFYVFFSDIETDIIDRRLSRVHLISNIVTERIDRAIDVGSAIAGRQVLRQKIQEGKWDDAMKTVDDVLKKLPYIERISFFDKDGNLKGANPSSPEIDEIVDQNFAFRDYYIGVSKNWEPYVASVIKPVVPIGYNFVPISIPLKNESGEVLGFLLLNVKLETFVEWLNDVGSFEKEGYLLLTDSSNNLVARSDAPPYREIIDMSGNELVSASKKTTDDGYLIYTDTNDGLEYLGTYSNAKKYNWIAGLVENKNKAFAYRDRLALYFASLAFAGIAVITFCLIIIYRDRQRIGRQIYKEKLLMNSIGDAVVAIDKNFKIISWNLVASKLTGWGADEALGRNFREILKFVKEHDMSEDIIFIEEVFLYGEARSMNPNTLLIRKDGTSIPVADSASPITDKNGNISGVIVIFRDELKQVQAQRDRELVILKTIHDLRSPATSIKLITEEYSDLRKLKKDPQILKKNIELVKNANFRMLELINSLLAEARNNKVQNKANRTELKDVIMETVKELSPLAEKNKVSLNFDTTQPLVEVLIDRKQLAEILNNLVNNSIKYNKSPGNVDIVYNIENNIVRIKVIDTGIGISESDIPKLFVPFSRLASDVEGTGLGLSIVKKIVESSGGTISCRSRVGEGTTFEVSLKSVNQ